MLKPQPPNEAGLPRLPTSPFQRAVPITPMDRTGACVDFFPVRAAFPVFPAGRHPHFTFEACSGFTRVTARGSLNRPRRPLSRGSDPASYPTKPLVSYQINRQLSGWNLPPLVMCAFGAHGNPQKLPWVSRLTPTLTAMSGLRQGIGWSSETRDQGSHLLLLCASWKSRRPAKIAWRPVLSPLIRSEFEAPVEATGDMLSALALKSASLHNFDVMFHEFRDPISQVEEEAYEDGHRSP